MVVRSPRQDELATLTRHLPDVDGMSHAACIDGQASDRGIYLVAWDKDVPVGRLFLRWWNNEIPRIIDEHPQASRFLDSPEICDLHVSPARRSQGIGAQLIGEALMRTRQRDVVQVTICVDTDNPRARALYERLEFSESGIGTFTTMGTFTDSDGKEASWQNGPQVLLVRDTGPA